jgi:diguanylate cyclase (GGDEF)-like protein
MVRLHSARLLRSLWPYVALWLVVAGAVGGYAWYEIASSRERELAAGRIEAENLARVLQEQVARGFETFDRTLALVKIVHEKTYGAIALSNLTDALSGSVNSELERRVLRFDREGQLRDSSDPEALRSGVSIADRPLFRRARERPEHRMLVGEPTLGPISGKMTIPLVKRLDTPAGEFDGVLVATLDPERLVHLFRAIRVGERSVVGIIHREGRLYVWSTSTDPLPAAISTIGIPRSATTLIGDEKRTLRDVVDAQGVVALSAVPGTDLLAFAALSEERLLADQRRYARGMIGFALLTLAALTLPIVLVARRAMHEIARRSRLEIGMAAERQIARTDALTEAANRRAFEDALARCHAELNDAGRPFVLAMVDVDRFKRLNDTRGHAIGDRALQRTAQTLMGGVRSSDLVARLGGDEFAVLMPGASAQTMHRPFDAMFTALTVVVAGEGWPISFSMGVIAFEGPIEQAQDASALADELMYAVKASGRNGVRFAIYHDRRLHPEPDRGEANEGIRIT